MGGLDGLDGVVADDAVVMGKTGDEEAATRGSAAATAGSDAGRLMTDATAPSWLLGVLVS